MRLREKLDDEAVKLLEELFIVEVIFFDMSSVEAVESSYEDVTFQTISSLQQAVEELLATVEEVSEKRTHFRRNFVVHNLQMPLS